MEDNNPGPAVQDQKPSHEFNSGAPSPHSGHDTHTATPPEPSAPAPVTTGSFETAPSAGAPISGGDAPFEPLPPLDPLPPLGDSTAVQPVAVVKVLSPRGVEYVFYTIALVTGALGLGSALISLVNGKVSFQLLSFPVALMAVSLPVLGWLFLRLKKGELDNPSLKLDPSKRRSTQFIQITSFLVIFFTLIGFLTAVFAKMGGQYHGSIVKLILDVIVVVVVAGGILAYYWFDEHR